MSPSRLSAIVASTLIAGGSGVANARSPEQIYRHTCALCHEETRVAPALCDRQLPSAAIERVVRSGLNGMPAFRLTDISDGELRALARYVTDLRTPGQTE